MSTTRQPLSVACELYPGNSEELSGEPHLLIVEYGGITKRICFYTIQELSALLLMEARLDRMPARAVEAALMHAGEWVGELHTGRAAMEATMAQRHGAPPDWAAQLFVDSPDTFSARLRGVALVGYLAAVLYAAWLLFQWARGAW